MPRGERGVALLEVLVALVILATVAVGVVGLLDGALREQQRNGARERELLAADRVLTASTLLTRDELDRRLGTREIGEYIVGVQRPAPTLYRIAVAMRAIPAQELLATVVYRPEPKP